MSEIQNIPFGGLAALEDGHLLQIMQAITASDCYLDTVAITGRNGYRSALAGAVVGTGTPQFIGRFRPSSTSERFVVVINGDVYLVTDPSGETASDATATKIGTGTFGSTDNICGDAMGTNFYLASDNATPVWVRIQSDYTLHTLLGLPTAVVPTFSLSTLSVIPLHGLSTTGSTLTIAASGVTGWDAISGTIGNVAIYTFATTYNWAEIAWLMVACSPETAGGGGTFKVEIGTAAGSYVPLATVYDPPNTNGSPWVLYASLVGLDTSILGAINKIRFTQLGPTTDPFCVYGVMPIPVAPDAGTVNYYVTYFNSVTGNESALSPALPVVYNNNFVTFPMFLAGRWNYNSFQNIGVKNSNPDTQSVSDEFNKGVGLAHPTAADFASIYTFTGSIPTGAQYNNADTVRLWRSTANGISLVGSSVYSTTGFAGGALRADGSAWTTGTGTNSDLPFNVTYWTLFGISWSITDNTGPTAVSNLIYKAGGPGPRITQMTSRGQRLIGIYLNRVYISSYTPTSDTSNPIPQWPAIAIETADGWSFDISPAPTEIGYVLSGNGDALYIGTSEMIRSMSDLSPNSLPFEVLGRGVLGRNAGIFVEDQFFWASYDGIYQAANQSQVNELTSPIRNYYVNTFAPTQAVVLAYQGRKLYAFQGNTYIRYDFTLKHWTTGTIADTVDFACCFGGTVVSPTIEQMWLLCANRFIGRWQASATRDMAVGTDATTGTAIPAWVFSTGFDMQGITSVVAGLMLDASGPVNVMAAKTLQAVPPVESRNQWVYTFPEQDEVYVGGWPDFRAYKFRFQFTADNTVTLYRAGREITPILEGHGG